MGKRLVTYSPKRVMERNFKTYPFDGKWRELLGCPSEDFSSIIYGKAKSGKSTFCLRMAQYLADLTGKRVLYVAAEEGISQTLQERISANNITNNKVRFVKYRKIDDILWAIDRVRPRFTIFDSVQHIGMTIKDFIELKQSQGRKIRSWHLVHQVTKSGQYKGDEEWAHETDVKIELKNGIAYAEGRFNHPSKMVVLNKGIVTDPQQGSLF